MIQINYFAIIVSAVASMVLGMIWYGPLLFGKIWMRIIGTGTSETASGDSRSNQKGMALLYITQLVLSILSFYVLAYYIAGWQVAPGARGGMINAFWIWLGFVMPTQAGSALWSGKPKKLAWSMFLIMAGYQLVNLLIAGTIIGSW